MACCGCSVATPPLGGPGVTMPPPPPQGISGALLPANQVGFAIDQTGEAAAMAEDSCGCHDPMKWWVWLLLGLTLGTLWAKRR